MYVLLLRVCNVNIGSPLFFALQGLDQPLFSENFTQGETGHRAFFPHRSLQSLSFLQLENIKVF